MIDQTTLARLIEESREEQESTSIMQAAEGSADGIDSKSQYSVVARQTQSELSMMQLNRVDRQVQTLGEAQHMLNELQRKRAEYDELFRSKGPDGLG